MVTKNGKDYFFVMKHNSFPKDVIDLGVSHLDIWLIVYLM